MPMQRLAHYALTQTAWNAKAETRSPDEGYADEESPQVLLGLA